MKIVFATNNQHKLDEIREILGNDFDIMSLNDIGCHNDIPEDHDTLQENALQKAQYIVDHYGVSCFADDTGLEVDALDGEPGVHSARYAEGTDHDSEANMQKLLRKLGNNNHRNARFRTVIALLLKRNKDITSKLFEGVVEGKIAYEKKGTEGFGYDPIFVPEGYDESFAQLGINIKNNISHRARAVKKLAEYLTSSLCYLVTFLLCYFATSLPCSAIGEWKAYLSYHDITEIERTGNELFVLASNNLYLYNTTDQSIRTFSKMDALSDCGIAHIAWNNKAKKLIVVYQNENIDLLELNGNCTNMSEYYMKSVTGDKTVNSIYTYDQYAYISTGFGILKLNVTKAEISDTYQLGFSVNYVYIENGNIYAASAEKGLYTASLTSNLLDKSNWKRTGSYVARTKTVSEELLTMLGNANPGGPKINNFSYMKFLNGSLYAVNGLDGSTGILQTMTDDEWRSYQSESIKDVTGLSYPGIIAFDIDPLDKNHLFACSRNGVYEFTDGTFVKHYNHQNSPIEMFDRRSQEYELVEGIKFDKEGNLWCLNSQAPTQAIIKMDRQGNWTSYPHSQLMKLNDGGIDNKSLGTLERMILDSRGMLWFVNDHWNQPSFYGYNPSTDELSAYTKIINQDGTPYAIEYVHCVAEDKSGNIWVGTNLGPFYLEPSEFRNDEPAFIQVKVPRNDGTNYADYLLSGVDISCITVDAGGRKWFGTYGNGVYLISEDNMTQLQHFTADNSNLLADDIEDIAINEKTGEVFFATSLGLCSYMSDATEASEEMDKDNVYAYPNPVRPDYTGLITVVGLSYNADVKIVTANGTLVAEGRSNGGSFTWDGRDQRNGKRVASGVYMVMSTTEDGEKGTVCKIAIVN